MTKKIAIIGTHSAGKSTLSYMKAVEYKNQKASVKIIQEIARSCPFQLNEGMSKEACLWIYHEQVKKEIENMGKFDYLICDRSVIDSFMYAIVQNCFDLEDKCFVYTCRAADEWMHTYDKIIYVKPCIHQEIFDDGFRSTDISFQKRVEEIFDIRIESLKSILKIDIMNSEDIFKNNLGVIV